MRLKRNTVTPVEATDPRVWAVASSTPMPASFYEWRPGPRTAIIFCPELNMLQVWSKTEGIGERQVTSLTVGEAPVRFAPPEGVAVQVRAEPAGTGLVEGLPSVLRERARREGQ